jgi:hypothetical protein
MIEPTRDRRVHEWWVEYKVAAQFSKKWDEVEEMAMLARNKRGLESPGSAPDLTKDGGTWKQSPANSIGSAQYWMQQVDVPRWFKFDELGIGTDESIWNTLATLDVKNEKRLRRYEAMLKQLEAARKAGIVSRKVTA